MKKKILLLASWYPTTASPIGGIFVQDQARILSRQYEVAVLAPQLVPGNFRKAGPFTFSQEIEQDEALIVYRPRVPVPLPRPRALAFLFYLPVVKKSAAKLMAEWGQPDLIHAHVVLPGGWAAVQLGKRYSLPVVLTEHSSPFAMQLRRPYQRFLVRHTLAQMQQVIAVSPALAQEIQDFFPAAPLVVAGNVIKTNFFVPPEIEKKSARGRTRFLSVALLSKQKGINYLLQAGRLLLARGCTSFELTIGGDGPERTALERLAHDLGLGPHCRFLGMLAPHEVKNAMQQCDVFVMPSLHESFCIVLGEAMACGKPVIATRCGGPEFVITPETGVLVEPANAAMLAEVMENFITHRAAYDAQQVRQSVVRRFGEEAFLQNLAAVYERIWSKI